MTKTYFKAVVREEGVFGGASYLESKWFPTREQAQAERGRLYAKANRTKKRLDTGVTLTTGIVVQEFDPHTETIWAEKGFLVKA